MRFVIYIDAAGMFRWRLYGPRERLLANCAEPYSSMSACMDAILLIRQAGNAVTEDQTTTKV